MAATLIQIVDEHDNPVTGATRKEAHKKGLYHRTVRIVIEDSHGRILVQKRSPWVAYPNRLCISAAGHVDVGESHDEAAHRELQEELGIAGTLEKIETFEDHSKEGDSTINRFVGVYKLVAPPMVQFRLQSEEVAEVKWLTIKEIKAIIRDNPEQTTPALKSIISRYYS